MCFFLVPPWGHMVVDGSKPLKRIEKTGANVTLTKTFEIRSLKEKLKSKLKVIFKYNFKVPFKLVF